MSRADGPLQGSVCELQMEPTNVSCCFLAVNGPGQFTLELQCLALYDEGDDSVSMPELPTTGHITPFITVSTPILRAVDPHHALVGCLWAEWFRDVSIIHSSHTSYRATLWGKRKSIGDVFIAVRALIL